MYFVINNRALFYRNNISCWFLITFFFILFIYFYFIRPCSTLSPYGIIVSDLSLIFRFPQISTKDRTIKKFRDPSFSFFVLSLCGKPTNSFTIDFWEIITKRTNNSCSPSTVYFSILFFPVFFFFIFFIFVHFFSFLLSRCIIGMLNKTLVPYIYILYIKLCTKWFIEYTGNEY